MSSYLMSCHPIRVSSNIYDLNPLNGEIFLIIIKILIIKIEISSKIFKIYITFKVSDILEFSKLSNGIALRAKALDDFRLFLILRKIFLQIWTKV